MLIRHLNLAFRKHGRWLFGIFTIVIIVSFIGFMVPGQFGIGGWRDPMAQAVGTAFGKPVSYEEAFNTLQGILLVNELLYNRPMGHVQREAEQGFLLTAQLRAAKARGIAASDKEMAELIRRMAAFQKDGRFDPKLYKEEVEKLRRRGIGSQDLADALANMIVLEKLQQEEMAAVVVTPGEARAFYDFFHTAFQLRIASFRAADYAAKVDASEAAVKAYFEQNAGHYEIPAKLTALIVEFPYDDPEALAEGQKITETELKDFFEKNQQAFADAEGKVPELAAVREKVRAELAALKTRNAVNRKAQLFAREADDLVNDAREPQSAFAKLVAERKAACIKTPVFSADALKIGDLEEPELVKQIDLAVATSPVTNPVFGRRAAYVGYLLTREEKRPAKLEEVADKVKADLIAGKSAEMAADAARAARDRVQALAPDKRAADPCWNGKGTFKLADYMFRLQAAGDQSELPPPALAQLATTLADGDITDLAATSEDAAFALVVGRTADDAAEYEKDPELWKTLWFQQKASLQNGAFQRYMAENCRINPEAR